MAPKKKQEKMALGDFLTNQSLGSWADEMDAQPLPAAPSGYTSIRDRPDRGDRDMGERRPPPAWETARQGSGVGGGFGGGMGDRAASYADRGYATREQLPLPTRPPYTAHLGNLAYDVKQADVEDFLAECKVTSVRLVEDKFDHKPKGFGYVEFETLEGLKKALEKSETSFVGRNIKISVAEPPKDRPEPSRDFSDWSRKGPLPDLPMNQRQPSQRGFSRNFDSATSDAGSERGGSKRQGFFEGDGKTRDFSNWERKGPISPAPTAGPPVRDGGRLRDGPSPGERRRSPAWGEGRSDAGSRPPRREFEPRPPVERQPTAADQDSQWRARMRPDASPAATPEASAPTSPAAQAPKERPRLNLAKRTVSTADPDAASSGNDSKASPFGAARPIDTATREREVEEKRELAVRQKQEADEKAKADKAAQDAAGRSARAERADRGQAQDDDKVISPTGGPPRGPRNDRRASRQQNGPKPSQPKENGDAPPKERPSFSILQHEGEEGVASEEQQVDDVPDALANSAIVGDKETKPQEIVREIPKDAPGNAAQNSEPTAETMQDDGWSTVPAKGKSSRRGGARALAS